MVGAGGEEDAFFSKFFRAGIAVRGGLRGYSERIGDSRDNWAFVS
jgi:hypothetical protein